MYITIVLFITARELTEAKSGLLKNFKITQEKKLIIKSVLKKFK